jgi:M6 family metalloprotease-like protein
VRARKIFAIAVVSLIAATLPTATAATKAGAACKKLGQTSIQSGKLYACVKSGKKLVWNKGVPIAKPTPTSSPNSQQSVAPTPMATPAAQRDWLTPRSTDLGYIHDYNAPCAFEKDLPEIFANLQNALAKVQKCTGINRLAQYTLGSARPTTALTSAANDLPTKRCEISEPQKSPNQRGFFNFFEPNRSRYLNASKVPGPKMTIQVVPIFASDTAKPTQSPEADYGAYTDFVANWARYSSDGESAIDVRYPKSYLEFSKAVASYEIYHENHHNSPGHKSFVKDLVADVDPYIDFTGVDVIIVVVPPGTPLVNFQQGTLKDFETKEGLVRSGTTEYAYTLEKLNSVNFANFQNPWMWIHELYHSGIGFDDHYGDRQNNPNTDYGLGWWTLMNPTGGDLSAWEKWVIGFMTDSQVHCIDASQPTTRWIAPSSVKTTEKKLIVIPISATKGIAIESIRAAGLYYKIPKASEGVLAYEIDLEKIGHGIGLTLILPTNRNPNQPPFFMSQATLRQGESVVSNGYKITVVESGTFGDVIKVEKA